MLIRSAKKDSARQGRGGDVHVRVEQDVILVLSFQSVLNITTVADEETEEQKVEKHKTFVEKHTKEIKHFGRLLPLCQIIQIISS